MRPVRTPADFDHEIFAAGAASLFLGRALRGRLRGNDPTFDLSDFQRCAERHQQAAVDEQFTVAARGLVEAGWTPLDRFDMVRRMTASSGVAHRLDIVAEATAQHPTHRVHPRGVLSSTSSARASRRPAARRRPGTGVAEQGWTGRRPSNSCWPCWS